MQILLVGLSHKTTPLELRERFAFSDEECTRRLHELVDRRTLLEGLIISTCNRVELLTTHHESIPRAEAESHIVDFLSRTCDIASDSFTPHLYSYSDADAVQHLFRVASSLDSMVVGEPQILGQVRRAYAVAHREGTANRVINKLIHTAFRVAKRVRTETQIAASAVSIASVAVRLARQIFNSIEDKTVLLIGAGEMAEQALKHLISAGATRILIVNRTDERARELANAVGGQAFPFHQLAARLHEADIVISSTASYDYIITPDIARDAMRQRKHNPAFYIDISVPRNIDPAVDAIENLRVFDLDDLQAVAADNRRKRTDEAARAEEIIKHEVAEFGHALRQMDFAPTIGAMRNRLEEIAQREYNRHRGEIGNLTPDQEHAIQVMLLSVVDKISAPVIHRMRRSYDTGELSNVQVWREIFNLKEQTKTRDATEIDSVSEDNHSFGFSIDEK